MYKNNGLAIFAFAFFFLTSCGIIAADFRPVIAMEPIEIEGADAVAYLREAIKEQLDAQEINFSAFQTILAFHFKLAQQYEFANKCPWNTEASFTNHGGCFCSKARFCDFSCKGSFAGRMGPICCEGENSESEARCCGNWLYLPCCPLQLLFGAFLPCGYADNCYCGIKDRAPNEKNIREALKTLNGVYNDKYWEKILKTESRKFVVGDNC